MPPFQITQLSADISHSTNSTGVTKRNHVHKLNRKVRVDYGARNYCTTVHSLSERALTWAGYSCCEICIASPCCSGNTRLICPWFVALFYFSRLPSNRSTISKHTRTLQFSDDAVWNTAENELQLGTCSLPKGSLFSSNRSHALILNVRCLTFQMWLNII